MLSIMQQGGWMMWVLLGVSLAGLAISLDRFFVLFVQGRLDTAALLQRVTRSAEEGAYARALKECNLRSGHPLPGILRAGLARVDRRDREIERAMEEEALRALPRLQRGVDVLGLLGNSATLLGLLGTIFGLIQAFSGVGGADAAARQQMLADGISMAMYTTAMGLMVAIPILYAHTLISGRVERTLLQMEEGSAALLNALSDRARPGAVARLAAAGRPSASAHSTDAA